MPVPGSAVTVNFDPVVARVSDAGWPFAATEVRNFIVYDGKIFMATGVWMDQVTPNIGPAVMRLDDGNSQFEIEQIWTAKDTAICLLHVASFGNVHIPIASTWQSQGFVDLHYRDYNNKSWHFAQEISRGAVGDKPAQARSAFNYTDPVTDTPLVFLGVSPTGICSIKYDQNARGSLAPAVVELPADRPQDRVMTFGVVRGKLYAAIYDRLWERQNGANPTWECVWEDPNPGESETGLRALTTINGQYSNNGYFFAGREGSTSAVVKLTPPASSGAPWKYAVAYDLPARLSEAWTKFYGGQVDAGYSIAGYNDMAWFQPKGPSGPWAMFVGIESFLGRHPANMPTVIANGYTLHALGAYLIWNFDGKGEWRLNHLPAATSQSMVSCRVGLMNPWGGKRFYIGGFDANYGAAHNTGYVVSLDMDRLVEDAVA